MTKGTPSMGRKNKTSHIRCRRCGRVAYKRNTQVCAACGYGKSAKMRGYAWQTHSLTRAKRITSRNQKKLSRRSRA